MQQVVQANKLMILAAPVAPTRAISVQLCRVNSVGPDARKRPCVRTRRSHHRPTMLRLDRRGSARSIALAKMMFAFAFVDKACRSRGMLRRGIRVHALGRVARHEVAEYRSSCGRSSSRPPPAMGNPNASLALNLRACGFTDSEDSSGDQLKDGSREVHNGQRQIAERSVCLF